MDKRHRLGLSNARPACERLDGYQPNDRVFDSTASAILGVSKRTLAKWRHERRHGDLSKPAFILPPGGSVQYRIADLSAFLENLIGQRYMPVAHRGRPGFAPRCEHCGERLSRSNPLRQQMEAGAAD